MQMHFSQLNKISKIKFWKNNWKKNNVSSSLAAFGNIIEMCKIGTFQRYLFTIFVKVLKIYLFSKIFQKVKIVIFRWNILQYLMKMLRQYFTCNQTLEIFVKYFYNILWYVSTYFSIKKTEEMKDYSTQCCSNFWKNEKILIYEFNISFALILPKWKMVLNNLTLDIPN